jgi:hypothetical protein
MRYAFLGSSNQWSFFCFDYSQLAAEIIIGLPIAGCKNRRKVDMKEYICKVI